MLEPQELPATAKSPLLVAILLKLRDTLWLLVRVTVWGGLVWPTGSFANCRLVGATVTGAIPIPASVAVWGLFVALSVTVTFPFSEPSVVGLNVIRMVQLALLPSVLGLSGQVPPLCAKLPLTAMLLMVRVEVAIFVSVSVLAALVVP